MRAAYLGCRETIGTDRRRTDAFEHDQMMEALSSAFAAKSDTIEAVRWDNSAVDWADYDAVLIGSCWDYQDRLEEFLGTLHAIEAQTMLSNSAALVTWNCRKTYLRALESQGVPIVPTLWIDAPASDWIGGVFEALGTDRIVVKRQIGANAEGQFLLHRGDTPPSVDATVMVQPFIESIAIEGEISFVLIDGAVSHTLVKRPASGDYRVQSSYGGMETTLDPSPADLASAKAVAAKIPGEWLYARVDMVRGRYGQLMLMELELIEPFLYPLQGDRLGDLIHAALTRRLG
ncbi:hypothetical protein [uncultured Parasphingopyxis sp.]|uniref:ATP-grasp domain-containing protein n=1 Tax=uncultured Parasphingopyxis sp. TaxID=1547918 RepID=UPI0026094F16|nr:hypothetical protein [uncultured Parasphingopyxis sp.]